MTYEAAKQTLEDHGQGHVLRYWDELDAAGRAELLKQIEGIDFAKMDSLIERWVTSEPAPETFDVIEPVEAIPVASDKRDDARQAWSAGEEALRAGRVGLLLVAGGQGTRLGFDGPKGAYPVGPVTGKTLFHYHAEKIRALQGRYGCTLPWYIMVSGTNRAATEAFFADHSFFGLGAENVKFFTQRMVPCVSEDGQFLLDGKGKLAMNPNGHGGVIPALVENGITEDCKARGVDTLSYFQVDNWAVKVADPYFIGYHVCRGGQMSSKVHRKTEVRESVGVHCLCDGEYRVIEYSALDMYPQLLETNPDGTPVHYAGNPAIHILDVGFVEQVFANYDAFPWWRAHKKIPYVDAQGQRVEPSQPNGYKFETFVFDALRFTNHDPIALEIARLGEYTPIKQFEGANSVTAARESMRELWGSWLDQAGVAAPRDAAGKISVDIELSPCFALTQADLLAKKDRLPKAVNGPLSIGPEGQIGTQQ